MQVWADSILYGLAASVRACMPWAISITTFTREVTLKGWGRKEGQEMKPTLALLTLTV